MTDPTPRDYFAEIAAATVAGDVCALSRLANELAGKTAAAEHLLAEEQAAATERKARDRARKAAKRPRKSEDSAEIRGTDGNPRTPASPSPAPSLLPPTPPNNSSPTPIPSTPKKRGAAKAPRPPMAEPVEAAPKGYVALAVEAWEGRYGRGTASGGKIAGALGQLVRAGHDDVLVVERWERFVASDESRFGPEYFRQHFADYAAQPTTGIPREIPAADLGRARSCGAVVETAFRDRGIDQRRSAWWQRILAEAKRLNRHPSVYAFEQLHTLSSDPALAATGN